MGRVQCHLFRTDYCALFICWFVKVQAPASSISNCMSMATADLLFPLTLLLNFCNNKGVANGCQRMWKMVVWAKGLKKAVMRFDNFME